MFSPTPGAPADSELPNRGLDPSAYRRRDAATGLARFNGWIPATTRTWSVRSYV
jgi:hypothetical protein